MTAADLRQALPRFEVFVLRLAPLLGDDSRPARAQAYLRGLLLANDDNQTAEAIAFIGPWPTRANAHDPGLRQSVALAR